ncbi:MAG: class I tRNA ligase family protein, partial [Methanosarcinales archaeon]
VEDFQLGIENNLPIFCPVGADGRYTEEIGEKYKNKSVKSADLEIITDLKEKGLVLASEEIVHRYGHCWRCKTPIIYLATEQWFLKVSEIKNDMLAEIDRVQWYPQWAGSSRFYDWISGARDWCISRQRYWGIPLPIWICKECKKIEVIGTVKELEEKIGFRGQLSDVSNSNTTHLTPNTYINLHRPYVDEIKLKCHCGGSMERVRDVFDVWFDSAVASWATLNYPRDSEKFKELWPADFITEGHDQTRGWFYSQLGASMIAFDRAPYKSVLMHGFTLDEQGRKMSKSIGNVVNPEEVVEKYGADTLRLYVLSQSAPWEDLKFNWEEVATIFKNLNIFWNVYRFPLLYMESDNFDPSITTLDKVRAHLKIEDKFILSSLQDLIKEVNNAMQDYQLHKAVRSILDYIVNDLSRWYLQIIRRRIWEEYISMDKLSAYRTFYEVLMTTAKLLAPYAPFITESMYQNLHTSKDPLTIHGCDYPEVNKELINKELEEQVLISRSIEEASANARQKVKRKLRWPVKRIIIKTESEKIKNAVYALENLIKDRTNSKAILVVSEWEELDYEVLPQMGVIGPAFTKSAGKIMKALKSRDINGKELKNALARYGVYKLREYEITPDMVEFKEKLPEYVASSEFTGGIVYVDAKLTPEIEAEGYAREVIRRIQDMRKDLDLDVEEKIYISLDIAEERIKALIESWMDYILTEVQGIECVEMAKDLIKEWDVDGVRMKIGIER